MNKFVSRSVLIYYIYLLILCCNFSIGLCKNEAFLTEEDYLRPLDDQGVIQLTENDFENAKRLSDDIIGQPKDKRNSHVLSRQKYYRGDIRGKAAWGLKSKEGVRRNGVVAVIKKWPNGRIPYVLSAQYNERERAVLARTFQEYHSKTCIRFVPKTPFDTDYLYIGKIDGCFSDVGRAGGRQELSLDDGCLQYDTAVHELMHSVGFYHEHERWDRDQFVTIMWHNIDKDAYDQFGKVDLTESSYYNQKYDYHSIMHYDSMAFSKNGFETLVTKEPEMTAVIGSAIDFSSIDLIKIRKMYQCQSTEVDESQSLMLNSLINGIKPMPVSVFAPPLAAPVPLPPVDVTSVGVPISTSTTASTDVCADKTTLCWRWLDRCQSFFFQKIMREFCPLSCGYCTPPQPAEIATLKVVAMVPPQPMVPPFPPVPIVLPQAELFNPGVSAGVAIGGSVNPEDQPYYQRFE